MTPVVIHQSGCSGELLVADLTTDGAVPDPQPSAALQLSHASDGVFLSEHHILIHTHHILIHTCHILIQIRHIPSHALYSPSPIAGAHPRRHLESSSPPQV